MEQNNEIVFLRAEWKNLIMANYAVDKKILEPYLPAHTELDLYNDVCYVSLIGFLFLNTRIKGFKIPFHINFEEVNLRFYVKYKENEQWKRGVVFIKEIVPKPALTFVANTVYGEHYETLPMSHRCEKQSDGLFVEYQWKKSKEWNALAIKVKPDVLEIKAGSEEEFITEHYWGYTKIDDHTTSQYGVEHPRWRVYETIEHTINVNFEKNYGKDFKFLEAETPQSVFLAEGSEICVKEGGRI
jgi:uncharacterized protein YqjF (DUF2071 family)